MTKYREKDTKKYINTKRKEKAFSLQLRIMVLHKIRNGKKKIVVKFK